MDGSPARTLPVMEARAHYGHTCGVWSQPPTSWVGACISMPVCTLQASKTFHSEPRSQCCVRGER
eukprot:3946548-Prymnesium_polylepis.2